MKQKSYKGVAMEGWVARWYDKIRGTPKEQPTLVHKIKAAIPQGARLLEIAPGPGHLARALAKNGYYRVEGLDISHTFVEMAGTLSIHKGIPVDFHQGDVADMPFEEESFDGIVCVAAFKNFSQPVKALQEMRRVLKKGGRIWILDLRKEVTEEDLQYHLQEEMQLRGLHLLFTRLIFKHFLLKNAYTRQEMKELTVLAGWARVDFEEDALSLYTMY
ncbi:MAG: class I SAM-dependent methyltransferase [Chlamydiae bacterium]|nr:class I SAM-dependent methyltransferase [Chlamydiota bacterium]